MLVLVLVCGASTRTSTSTSTSTIVLPFRLITDRDLTAAQDLSEHSASPRRLHGGLKSGNHFIHPLARRELSADRESGRSDDEHTPPRSRERDSAQHDVGAPALGIGGTFEISHTLIPTLAREERHLAPRASPDAASFDQRRARDGVHRPSMRALEPDCFDPPDSLGQLSDSRRRRSR